MNKPRTIQSLEASNRRYRRQLKLMRQSRNGTERSNENVIRDLLRIFVALNVHTVSDALSEIERLKESAGAEA